MKKLALSIPILFLLLCLIAGCALSNNAATASMHNSDNRLAAEQARNERLEAEARAEADAKIATARESTQQQLYAQNGASERLYAQSQYLIAINAQNSENMRFILIFLLVVASIIGGIGLLIYFRENPKPVPWGYQLPMNQRQVGVMPMEIAENPRTQQAGWQIDWIHGEATREVNGVIEIAQLEDKQL